MNSTKYLRSILISSILISCVDRLFFDLEGYPSFIPVVQGFISDRQGPYEISLTRSFDVKQTSISRTPISAKKIVLSDNTGLSEELSEVREGVYQTAISGIKGQVGRVYKLKIEFDDGRIYESIPDTLVNSGEIDSIYYNFFSKPNVKDIPTYGFDIFLNATASVKNGFRFLWKFKATFQAETNPELIDPARSQCYPLENYVCNFFDPCSGLRNIGTTRLPRYERAAPCSCCTCWYDLFNKTVLLNDDQFVQTGRFDNVNIYFLPISHFSYSSKVHIEVSQFSLTKQSLLFWKAIKDQKEAINSLFQSVNGKIPSNFIQLGGREAPIAGIFYAASISTKTTYINKTDVPNGVVIPARVPYLGSCFELFPNATNLKPDFWID